MEIPRAEHNLRNSVIRLTCSKLKCYTTLIRRDTGSAKRGEPSEAKSGKPINVVHMSSTFVPSLTVEIIFRRIGSHDRYRKRGLQTLFANGRKKNWSRFRVVLTKEMQGGNKNASRQQSDYFTHSSYQEMKGCRRKYKLNIQIH